VIWNGAFPNSFAFNSRDFRRQTYASVSGCDSVGFRLIVGLSFRLHFILVRLRVFALKELFLKQRLRELFGVEGLQIVRAPMPTTPGEAHEMGVSHLFALSK
jgi:hypothetical protein